MCVSVLRLIVQPFAVEDLRTQNISISEAAVQNALKEIESKEKVN
jgi:hypothetical protein